MIVYALTLSARVNARNSNIGCRRLCFATNSLNPDVNNLNNVLYVQDTL
jgi:hypothetical protein